MCREPYGEEGGREGEDGQEAEPPLRGRDSAGHWEMEGRASSGGGSKQSISAGSPGLRERRAEEAESGEGGHCGYHNLGNKLKATS